MQASNDSRKTSTNPLRSCQPNARAAGPLDVSRNPAYPPFGMERLRTPAARFLLALGLLAWIGVTWADQLHAYLVVHAICPDHGEIVELAHGHGHVLSPHDGVSIGKADVSSEHDHGCASLLCQLDM